MKIPHKMLGRPSGPRRRLRPIVFSCLVVVILLSIIEASCYITFKHPQWIPEGFLVQVLRANYLNNRDFIQFDKSCAKYDPSVAYTLRPGRCVFSGVEFHVQVEVNKLGLRDDDSSARQPEIIVLGDSHAMGWGVEQGRTFPQLLETSTGRRTLNAAISSYGTAREILIFRRLDTSRLRYLVVQYCPNDFDENRNFVRAGYRLKVMSRRVFEQIERDVGEASTQEYIPGQFVRRTLRVQVLRRFRRLLRQSTTLPDYTGPLPRASSPKTEAAVFLDVLTHSGVNLKGIPIIVLAIDAYKPYSRDFLAAVDELANNREANPLHLTIRTLDLSERLIDADFFRLDDHLNARGHAVISEMLRNMISPPFRQASPDFRSGEVSSDSRRAAR